MLPNSIRFCELVEQAGRVRMLPLPPELSNRKTLKRKLAAKVDSLRSRIPSFDVELGITFPVIEVIPTCLKPGDAWGRQYVVMARKTYRPAPDGFGSMIVIQVCAPTILVAPDAQLDAILAHEFLHYVQDTLAFFAAARDAGDGQIVSEPVDPHPEYMGTEDNYHRLDTVLRAEPREWLSERLLGLLEMYESGQMKEAKRTMRLIFEKWIAAGYPIEAMDPTYRFEGHLLLDEAVAQKAKLLR